MNTLAWGTSKRKDAAAWIIHLDEIERESNESSSHRGFWSYAARNLCLITNGNSRRVRMAKFGCRAKKQTERILF